MTTRLTNTPCSTPHHTRRITPPDSTPYRTPYRAPYCYEAGTDLFFREAARLAELQRALSEVRYHVYICIHIYVSPIHSPWLYSPLAAYCLHTRWA